MLQCNTPRLPLHSSLQPPWLADMAMVLDMVSAMVQDMAPILLMVTLTATTATAIKRTHGRTPLRTTPRRMAITETHSQLDRKMERQIRIEKAGMVLISASHQRSSSTCHLCRAQRSPCVSLEETLRVTKSRLPSSRARPLSSKENSVLATMPASTMVWEAAASNTHLR